MAASGEPARKRRLVGSRDAVEDEQKGDKLSPVPRGFCHYLAPPVRAVCLVFCFQNVQTRASFSLWALPEDVLRLIVRHIVESVERRPDVARFACPEKFERVGAALAGSVFERVGAALAGSVKTTITALALCSSNNVVGGVLTAQLLASGREDGIVQLWDCALRECVATLAGHTGRVTCLSFVSDAIGPILASGSKNGTIVVWDAVGHWQIARLRGQSHCISALTFFTDASFGPCLVSAAGLVPTKPPAAVGPHPSATVRGGVEISHLAQPIASDLLEVIRLWDARKGIEIATLHGHLGGVYSLCVFTNATGTTCLASGGEDKDIKVWDLATREKTATLCGHRRAVHMLACYSSGNGAPMLVSGGADRMFKVWDMDGCLLVKTLLGIVPDTPGEYDVGPISFLSCCAGFDGRVLLVAKGGTRLTLIDLWTGRQVGGLEGTAFVPYFDGASGTDYLAVAGNDGRSISFLSCEANSSEVPEAAPHSPIVATY
jgi:WD40 repeat protein